MIWTMTIDVDHLTTINIGGEITGGEKEAIPKHHGQMDLDTEKHWLYCQIPRIDSNTPSVHLYEQKKVDLN
jgi:hypothetical protein